MGTTLTGKNISASYLGLLKTTDNAVIGGTAKIITDGNGNDSPLYLSTTRVGIGITPTSLLHVNGDANINTLTVGLGSGSISTNTVFGNNALNNNTTGYMNTAIGVDALRNNTDGDNNIAIGRLNLNANTSGIRNVALGNQSLTSNTTGSYNVGLGYDGLSALSSGGYNIGIGYEAGNNITTGTGSIMIGGITRSNGVTSSNEIVIGYNTTGNGSNTVTIGNSSITTNYFSGDILLGNSENLFWGNTSDVYISGTTISDNIQLGVGGSTQFTFSQASGLRLHQYGGGTITGTATQRLGVDSSGNVIEIPIGGGAVDGSGTANTVTMWTPDSNTIGDAPITISGNNSTFAGNIRTSGNILFDEDRFIGRNTSDGSDNGYIALAGGGANSDGRGARIRLYGNEHASLAGVVDIATGNIAGSDMLLSATDTIQFSSGGSEKMRLDSSGRLGLGTTSPAYELVVNDETGSSAIQLRTGTTTSENNILFADSDSNAQGRVQYNHTGDYLALWTAGSERARLDSSGRLGLGTISPASILHLVGQGGSGWTLGARNVLHLQSANPSSTNVSNAIVLGDQTDADRWLIMNDISANGTTANVLTIINAGNERMRLDSSGRLGIGRTPTSNLLEVADTIKLTDLGTGEGFIGFNTNGQKLAITAVDSVGAGMKFEVGASERMRLDSSGNLELNGSAGPLFSVKSTATGNPTAFVYASTNGADFGSLTNNPTRFYVNNSEKARIDTSGNFLVTKTSAGVNFVGVEARAVGQIIATSDGDNVGYFNRKTSDGDVIQIRKDNSTVGVIGTQNWGIGTDSPQTALQILSEAGTNVYDAELSIIDTRALSANTGGGIKFGGVYTSTGTTNADFGFIRVLKDNATSGNYSYSMAFGTRTNGQSPAERLRITSDGDVGIGAGATVDDKLHIVGDSAKIQQQGQTGITLKFNHGNNASINSDINIANIKSFVSSGSTGSESGGIAFETKPSSGSATERMRITSDGFVGVGTTSIPNPFSGAYSNILQVGTDSGNTRFAITAGSSSSCDLAFADSNDASVSDSYAGSISYKHATDSMLFSTATSERMRITSGGDVEITGGYVSSQTFQSTGSLRVSSNSTTSTSNVALELMNDATGTRYLASFTNLNGVIGSISTLGTATSFNTSSDYRLKENVVELTGALDRISQLKPSRFNFIADAETTVDGFLAHEVQEIVPEAIVGDKDAVDEEGNAMYQGIDQSKLVPLLVASIQELKAEIDELKKNK